MVTKKTAKRPARSPAKKTTKTAKKTVRSVKKSTKAVAKKRAPATRKATGRPSNGRSSSARVDAIALLKRDHREVEALFKRFEKAGSGARRKEQLRDAITVALSQHATIEEVVFYP